MMRYFLSNLAVFTLLFASIEGATDLVVHGLPHGDSTMHGEVHNHALDAHDDERSNGKFDGLHCDHCCHAHLSSIAQLHPCIASIEYSRQTIELSNEAIPDYLVAPPTPPPDPTYLS